MNELDKIVHDVRAVESELNSDLSKEVKDRSNSSRIRGFVSDALNALQDINDNSLPGSNDTQHRIRQLCDRYGLFYDRGKFH